MSETDECATPEKKRDEGRKVKGLRSNGVTKEVQIVIMDRCSK